MDVDYVVVGAGITGATIARLLTDAGCSVVVVERRTRVGGNAADHIDEATGLFVHDHGPHLFRTSSERIWNLVTRFGEFREYRHRVLSLVDGTYYPWPLGASTLRRLTDARWRERLPSTAAPASLEEAALSLMPRVVYEMFVKEYNDKQWGLPARELAPELCRRFDVRDDDDPTFSQATYQGIPMRGYSALVEQMLAGIPVILDRTVHCDDFRPRRRLFFTGPIDAYYGHRYGRLRYRCQQRVHTRSSARLRAAVINNPVHRGGAHIRTIDWSWLSEGSTEETIWTTETPRDAVDLDDLEYPFPSAEQTALYERYRAQAAAEQVTFCGRLGEYRYLDMDQAIARAIMLVERELTV